MFKPALMVRRLTLIGALALLGLAWFWPEPPYLHRESYRNVLEVNQPSGVDTAYAPEFALELKSAPLPAQVCAEREMSQATRPNVIVIAVESLSSYHSKLLSGVWDLTPRLDALMRQHSYFTEFNANGFTTDGGLIALFAGRAPIPAQHRYQSAEAFAGFDQANDDFYQRIHALGYRSAFLKSSDLGFLKNGAWLRRLGFQHVEDSTARFYDGMPKGQFGAVEDRALYQRLLQWVDAQPASDPFFVGMLTTSSHPPFVVPGAGLLDEQATFRYVDQTLDELVQQLQERGYFRNGLLLITGDHRSMTALKPGEYARFGELAYQRVPMLVIGPSGLPQGAITGNFQQSDVLPSLLSQMQVSNCRQPWQGLMLGAQPVPAQFAVIASGHERDNVWLLHADGLSKLHLDGAQSWLSGPPLPGPPGVIEAIHRERIARGPVADNLTSTLLGW